MAEERKGAGGGARALWEVKGIEDGKERSERRRGGFGSRVRGGSENEQRWASLGIQFVEEQCLSSKEESPDQVLGSNRKHETSKDDELTSDLDVGSRRKIGDSDAGPGRLGITGEHGDVSLVEVGKVLGVLGEVDGRSDD